MWMSRTTAISSSTASCCGNLFVSGSATAEITGSIFADEILDSGRLTIYGLVTSKSGPYHANMRPGAYVNMILH